MNEFRGTRLLIADNPKSKIQNPKYHDMLTVKIKRLPHNPDLPLPQKMSEHSSGFDLMAALGEPISIAPGETAFVPTGIALSIPP
ncbi:hypothetical protein HZA56_20835, partial [Candidatus Poribacteria bacterium]|nr:hypothetical protein [Candidatus Poribacteria bacterium]